MLQIEPIMRLNSSQQNPLHGSYLANYIATLQDIKSNQSSEDNIVTDVDSALNNKSDQLCENTVVTLKEEDGVLTSGSNITHHTLSEDILTELDVKKGDDLAIKSGLYQLFSTLWLGYSGTMYLQKL